MTGQYNSSLCNYAFYERGNDNTMFDFLKKYILQDSYIVPEPQQELKLTVRERALNVFSEIEGLDDIKEMMLRAVESPERAHTLLIGPPACAKSLFMLEIEKLMRSKVYFAEGSSTTKAGLQKFIAENPRKEIIIVGEIDILSIKDQEGLLIVMERGTLQASKSGIPKLLKLYGERKLIFATS